MSASGRCLPSPHLAIADMSYNSLLIRKNSCATIRWGFNLYVSLVFDQSLK